MKSSNRAMVNLRFVPARSDKPEAICCSLYSARGPAGCSSRDIVFTACCNTSRTLASHHEIGWLGPRNKESSCLAQGQLWFARINPVRKRRIWPSRAMGLDSACAQPRPVSAQWWVGGVGKHPAAQRCEFPFASRESAKPRDRSDDASRPLWAQRSPVRD